MSLTVWRQNGDTKEGAKRKKGRNLERLRPVKDVIYFTIWLRGQDLLKTLQLVLGYEVGAGTGFEPDQFNAI